MAASAASAFEPSGPPAFAAERLGPPARQIDGIEAPGQVGGNADDEAGLAFAGNADDGDDAGADLLLAFVGEAAQVLELDARDGPRHQPDVADGAHAVGAVTP